jgi:hypothetical protein
MPASRGKQGCVKLSLDHDNSRKLLKTGSWEGLEVAFSFESDKKPTFSTTLLPIDSPARSEEPPEVLAGC